MYQVHPITSLEDPALAMYRTMRLQEEHRRERLFVAEGDKVVERLLQSDLEVVSVVLPDRALTRFVPLLEKRHEEFPVYVAEKRLLETLTGFPLYQGVMAVGRVPAEPSLESVLATARRPHLILALDGITSSENVGALTRTAGALGVTGVLAGNSCSPYLRRAVRASMGAVFRLPVMEVPSLVPSLRAFKDRKIYCVAAHPHATPLPLPAVDLTSDVCIVVGSEGTGISTPVLEACDVAVAIPMNNDVDSLNVGNAAAVFLYEVARQRQRL